MGRMNTTPPQERTVFDKEYVRFLEELPETYPPSSGTYTILRTRKGTAIHATAYWDGGPRFGPEWRHTRGSHAHLPPSSVIAWVPKETRAPRGALSPTEAQGGELSVTDQGVTHADDSPGLLRFIHGVVGLTSPVLLPLAFALLIILLPSGLCTVWQWTGAMSAAFATLYALWAMLYVADFQGPQ